MRKVSDAGLGYLMLGGVYRERQSDDARGRIRLVVHPQIVLQSLPRRADRSWMLNQFPN